MAKINSEEDYIFDRWQRFFAPMKDRKLAIYGIGKNTKHILNHFAAANVVGLMDAVRTGEEIFGKPVISIQDAAAAGVSCVVIVARASNVRVIYRRIADVCLARGVDVYDINGNKIKPPGDDDIKCFDEYGAITEELLRRKIDGADIVSFDIFDTLIMRDVLYPRDIFALLAKSRGADFEARRVKAETELYGEGKHPTIYEIYARIGEGSPEAEIELERRHLAPRRKMAAALNYAQNRGKAVFLVSDMYFPREVMARLLQSAGIAVDPENILVSCDYGVSKSSGLFETLLSYAGTKRLLHIGDNYEADITSAIKCGVGDTFHVRSSLQMLEDSYASELLKYDRKLPDRLLIGKLLSEQLNDPFLFSQTQGKLGIDSVYAMSRSLIAPLLYRFFGWLVSKSRELGLDLILLSSRDGYIIEKIYRVLSEKGLRLPRMKYFYCSRAAAVPAGCIDDADILHAARLAYSGKIEDMLKTRFNLTGADLADRKSDLSDEDYVLLHRDAILKQAELCRRQYVSYIDQFKIPAGASIGFFDFVSSGTCQKALGNFVNFNLIGLYVAQVGIEAAYKSNTVVYSMFGAEDLFANSFTSKFGIYENSLFIENIISSFEPTLARFDDGRPVFTTDHRSAKELRDLGEMHQAIIDYVNDSQIPLDGICESDIEVVDFILSLLKSKFSVMNTDYFDEQPLTDEFCNRIFNLADVAR